MTLLEIVTATGRKPINFKNTEISSICVDSRNINKGDVFIAIKGERFDGHNFVEEAFEKGAAAAIVRRTRVEPARRAGGASPKGTYTLRRTKRIIVVKDTLRAVGDIAHYHRMKFDIPVIGITGSCGKTTAKEILSHILGKRFNVLKNEGTKNNLIGLPLTLLQLNKSHQICILEMGTNRFGEIERLTFISKPSIGLITNIGPSHLEFLKDTKNVFKEKSRILSTLDKDGCVVLNKDDKFLSDLRAKCRKIYYGINGPCDYKARRIEIGRTSVSFEVSGIPFKLNMMGKHSIYNALSAIAISKHIFGMDWEDIKNALADFKNPFSNRLSYYKNHNFEILDDTYNSNPLSFERSIKSLLGIMGKNRKVIITSDMLELGSASKLLHEKIGREIARSGVDMLITTGEMSAYTSRTAMECGMSDKNIRHFDKKESLIDNLGSILEGGDVILVKGSRATHMEEIVNALKNLQLKTYNL